MSVERRVAAAYVAQHRAQRHEGLVDQGQPERLDRVEVAVERGRHDADLLGHLAQREGDQAGPVGERQRRVEDRPRVRSLRSPRLPGRLATCSVMSSIRSRGWHAVVEPAHCGPRMAP